MEGFVEKKYAPQEVQWIHPFTCIVTGPSGCGKTTFVKQLLLAQEELISQKFDKIYVFLGTELKANKIFEELKEDELLKGILQVVELPKLYPQGLKAGNFRQAFTEIMDDNVKQNIASCVIFDDLMSELADIQLLDEMFTKRSSHGNMSVIHITQNMFYKGKGGGASGAATLYRNSKVLVLFNAPMDHTTVSIIARRLAKDGKMKRLEAMLSAIMDEYRYVCIRANLQTPVQLKYTSDLFATQPVRHIKNFTLLPLSQK